MCSECYSEASDPEEAETTEAPPPPYSEQTGLRDSGDAAGPPASGQVSVVFFWTLVTGTRTAIGGGLLFG